MWGKIFLSAIQWIKTVTTVTELSVSKSYLKSKLERSLGFYREYDALLQFYSVIGVPLGPALSTAIKGKQLFLHKIA